jgi:hypothetical protein
VTEHLLHAKLLNAGGELIAEGPCWLDEPAGVATLEPEREPGAVRKERGLLALELDSGRRLPVDDKPMVFRLGRNGHGTQARRSLYRLRLVGGATQHAQDAGAVGAVEEGASTAPMPSERLRNGETPAAR